MKVYYGKWQRKQDMLDWFGIDNIGENVIILLAGCFDENIYVEDVDILALVNGKLQSSVNWRGGIFSDTQLYWEDPIKYTWECMSQEFRLRYTEILNAHNS